MQYQPYIFKQIGLLKQEQSAWADPENSVRGGGVGGGGVGVGSYLTTFFSKVFHIGLYEPPSRNNCTQGVQLLGSVPVFLRKPLATCDFPGVCVCVGGGGGGPHPAPPRLDPPMAWLGYSLLVIHLLYSIHLYRPPDKNAYLKIIFHSSQPKCML